MEAEGEGVQGPGHEAVAHQALVPEPFGQGQRLVDHRRSGFEGGHPGAGHAGPGQHLGPLGCLALPECGQPPFGLDQGLPVAVEPPEIQGRLEAHPGRRLPVAQRLVARQGLVPVGQGVLQRPTLRRANARSAKSSGRSAGSATSIIDTACSKWRRASS